MHWLDTAHALHPELETELFALQDRVEEASGDISGETDAPGWFTGTFTDGETVLALEKIVAIMRELAPLIMAPSRNH
jgi:hypothetical protein